MAPRILLRALRWRRLSALSLLAVATVAIAASAIGPIYLRAADDSAMTSALEQARVASTEVSLVATGGANELTKVTTAAGLVAGLGRGRWFSPPVLSVDTGVAVSVERGQPYGTDLLSRTDVCGHVRLIAGSCPTTPAEAAVSIRSARLAGIGLGQTVMVSSPRQRLFSTRVVALYDPPSTVDNDYWNDNDYFAFGTPGIGHRPELDPLLTDDAAALRSVSLGVRPQISADIQLRSQALRSNDVGGFEHSLHAVITMLGTRYSLAGSTPLFSFLQGTAHAEGVMATVVEAALLQLVLLALLVLYAMVALSGRDRQLEIDIARRRGFPRRSLLIVAIGEPLVLLTAALPLGLLAAWIVMALVGPALFVAGTPITLTITGVFTALVGLAGGVVAAIVASWALWHGLIRSAEDQSRSRSVAAAVDASAVALAGAGIIALSV
jgi:putative ABC transport system permease protein